jgi:hypothetical protein
MGMPRDWSMAQRIEHGRDFLVKITRQDFRYDAMRWHDYLWDTDAGGYRWCRRSREKWARQVELAINNPEWQAAVRELEVSGKALVMTNAARTDPVAGEVLAHGSNLRHLCVRLTGGDEIEAVLPKNQKFGCLFGSLVGWRVKVVFRPPPKMARVVDLARPAHESTGS